MSTSITMRTEAGCSQLLGCSHGRILTVMESEEDENVNR